MFCCGVARADSRARLSEGKRVGQREKGVRRKFGVLRQRPHFPLHLPLLPSSSTSLLASWMRLARASQHDTGQKTLTSPHDTPPPLLQLGNLSQTPVVVHSFSLCPPSRPLPPKTVLRFVARRVCAKGGCHFLLLSLPASFPRLIPASSRRSPSRTHPHTHTDRHLIPQSYNCFVGLQESRPPNTHPFF